MFDGAWQCLRCPKQMKPTAVRNVHAQDKMSGTLVLGNLSSQSIGKY